MSTPDAERTIDAITFEVLRRAFDYIPERMSQVLQKASFSPIIYDIVDYSNAIFDPDAQLIGQTANCPVHIAAMHFSVQAALERYPLETLGAEDVVILNDPYAGGTHTPDVTLTMPVFHEGELIAIAVSRAHWTDLGGNLDTHVGGEGLRLPPLKLYDDGALNEDLVAVIRNCTRTPQYVEGDLQAQLGALRAARTELQRLAGRYGRDVLRLGMTEMLDHTERMTATAVDRIPNGEYVGEDYVDSDGFSEDPVTVKVRLTVSGSRIHVDLTGSDPVTVGPINFALRQHRLGDLLLAEVLLEPRRTGQRRPLPVHRPDDPGGNLAEPALARAHLRLHHRDVVEDQRSHLVGAGAGDP